MFGYDSLDDYFDDFEVSSLDVERHMRQEYESRDHESSSGLGVCSGCPDQYSCSEFWRGPLLDSCPFER
jgi:hypothetical protein